MNLTELKAAVWYNLHRAVGDLITPDVVTEVDNYIIDYFEERVNNMESILASDPELIAALVDVISGNGDFLATMAGKEDTSNKNIAGGYQGIEANGDINALGNVVIPAGKAVKFQDSATLLAQILIDTDFTNAWQLIYILPYTGNRKYRFEYILKAGTTVDPVYATLIFSLPGAVPLSLGNESNPPLGTVITHDFYNNGNRQVYISVAEDFTAKFAYLKIYELKEVAIDGSLLAGTEQTANKNQEGGYMGLDADAKAAKGNLPADIVYSDQKNAANGVMGLGTDSRASKANLPTDIIYLSQITSISESVDELQIQINEEISDREAATEAVQTNVDAEAATRAANDDAITAAMANKADLVGGKVPATQLPQYLDDVLDGYYINATTFNNEAGNPYSLTKGVIYVDVSTLYEYRWSGSVLTQLVASPGSSDAVPEGTTNLYFTISRVLSSVIGDLTGFISNTAISATDTVKQALGKLQGQVNANATAIATNTSNIATNASAISTEAATRVSADTTLDSNKLDKSAKADATTANAQTDDATYITPLRLSTWLTNVLTRALTWSGINSFSNTTESTSTTTGGVIISGGIGVAKRITSAYRRLVPGSTLSSPLEGDEWRETTNNRVRTYKGSTAVDFIFSAANYLLTGSTTRAVYANAAGDLVATDEVIDDEITDSTIISNITNIANWTATTYTGPSISSSKGMKYRGDATYFFVMISNTVPKRFAYV